MKHAVIVAHPNPDSLTLALARAYVEAAKGLGHGVVLRDLYRMGFDPCLKAGEIPAPGGYAPGEDVMAEREQVCDADVFAFVYPLWFNAPPAMLKGYIDRVFGMGFGYVAGPAGTRPALEGRRLIAFSLSGAPDRWMRETGALEALITLFDRHLAQLCGLTFVDHIHTGDVTPGITSEAAEEILSTAGAAVRRRFGPREDVLA